MEMKKAFGLFTLLVLATFLATSSATYEEILKLSTELEGGKSGCEKWCDFCLCTKSIPPQCRCGDMGPSCYPACKACVCTRSIPPQCRCTDVKNYC